MASKKRAKKHSSHEKNPQQKNKKKQKTEHIAPVEYTTTYIRQLSLKMTLYGLVGIIGIIATAFLFHKLQHPMYQESFQDFRFWGLLLFLSLFFGIQCGFLGFCYLLFLIFKPKYYPSEKEVLYYGWASSYLNVVLSFIVSWTISYVALILCYFVIFPLLCVLIYREFR